VEDQIDQFLDELHQQRNDGQDKAQVKRSENPAAPENEGLEKKINIFHLSCSVDSL
jgi:hypothetical protein